MRQFAVSAALLVALSACVAPDIRVSPDEPLEISILPPSTGFGFWVNQPAYVAMFDITPNEGVRLLYPYVSGQLTQTVSAGSTLAVRGFGFRTRTYFAGRRLQQAHFILAVASRKPLNISHTAGYSEWITYKLGMSYFSGTAFGLTNALFDEVILPQPDGDWATAMYVVYPQVDWRSNIYRYVRCSDGFVYLVNVETSVFYCPRPEPAPDKPPVDDDRTRRPERPSIARAGRSISRAMQAGQLPILRAGNDVITRPPEPLSLRTSDRGYVTRTSGRISSASNEDGRRPNSTVTPSQQPSSQPGVVGPQAEQSTRPGAEPRGESSQRGHPTKDP